MFARLTFLRTKFAFSLTSFTYKIKKKKRKYEKCRILSNGTELGSTLYQLSGSKRKKKDGERNRLNFKRQRNVSAPNEEKQVGRGEREEGLQKLFFFFFASFWNNGRL